MRINQCKKLPSGHGIEMQRDAGTRLECRLGDYILAGRLKSLKAKYTPKPNIHQGQIKIYTKADREGRQSILGLDSSEINFLTRVTCRVNFPANI